MMHLKIVICIYALISAYLTKIVCSLPDLSGLLMPFVCCSEFSFLSTFEHLANIAGVSYWMQFSAPCTCFPDHILRIIPVCIRFGFLMPFFSASALTDVPYSSAIWESVSPFFTMYVLPMRSLTFACILLTSVSVPE